MVPARRSQRILTRGAGRASRAFWAPSTTNHVVVPVNKVVHVLVTTGADVIHSFAVSPSFGVKMDAVPGRINQTWFKATIQGGHLLRPVLRTVRRKDHAFMPITVEVVTDDKGVCGLGRGRRNRNSPTARRAADDSGCAAQQ